MLGEWRMEIEGDRGLSCGEGGGRALGGLVEVGTSNFLASSSLSSSPVVEIEKRVGETNQHPPPFPPPPHAEISTCPGVARRIAQRAIFSVAGFGSKGVVSGRRRARGREGGGGRTGVPARV